MLLSYPVRLLVVTMLLAGCRSEKVAFHFRPPAPAHQIQRPKPVPPDTPTAPAAIAAPPRASQRHTRPLAQAVRRHLVRPPFELPRQLVARLSRPLTRNLKRPLREQAIAQEIPKPVRFGLVLMGMAVLLMVIVLLAAPSVVTFEGAILAYVGYLLALGTFITGAVTAVLGLLLAKS